ncbi:carbohydrate ABC transporter permease [Candidatus Caldatribacterium saccharofermentans]|uniref:Carbohydrate ABC transporter permease n=1 Tax=Candidatus Caldatribacterium saccharofermentans TaxID=1454753 RepID=A0A7V4WJW7_9BACT
MGVVRRRSKVALVFRYVLVGIILFWALFMIYWGVVTSLKPPAETFTVTGLSVPFVQFRPTLENWRTELSVRESRMALLNSVIVAIFATLIAMALGVPAGYALARFKFRRIRNRDLTIWYLSQRVLPPVVVVIPFFLIMRTLRLLDTRLALILVNATFTLPFAVVITRQAFQELPVELEEAAAVDGCSEFTAFWKIALPLAAPTIVAVVAICVAFTWNEFLFALSLTSLRAKTFPVYLAGAEDTRGVQFWFMATRAILALGLPVVLAVAIQKYIVRGLTFGAVKG